ncbi:hypothetical protein NHQ30_000241 [Ciborinia camelliae]|nr:hypothetical protein NHQ30_000241 [Ciborinia camelliae]
MQVRPPAIGISYFNLEVGAFAGLDFDLQPGSRIRVRVKSSQVESSRVKSSQVESSRVKSSRSFSEMTESSQEHGES